MTVTTSETAPAQSAVARNVDRPLRRLLARRSAKVSIGIAVVFGLLALFGPLLVQNPNATHYARQLLPPSGAHWLGTDEDGRDELARTIYGLRTTLSSSLLIFAITTTVGLLLGGMAGYFGGLIDAIVSRLIDVLLGLPSIIIALAIVGALGVGYWNLVLAISLSGWAYVARIARSYVLGGRNRLDVTAARMAGVSQARVFFTHILPAAVANVLVAAASTFGDTILSLAGLSFLGLGAQPPTAELGQMLNDSRGYLASSPWLAVGPTIALIGAVTSAALLSDALRDVTDVKTTRVRIRRRSHRMREDTARSARTPALQRATNPLIVTDLEVVYPDGSAAVRGVSLTVGPGECVAVVGESGCGKTTLARCLLRLLPGHTTATGTAQVGGIDVLAAGGEELHRLRGAVAGYVAQDPYAACDPLQVVRRHVEEPWRTHRVPLPKGEAASRTGALGVTDAVARLRQRPHQWSGGMLQRATVAAANAHAPALTIADEPTSALDAELGHEALATIRKESGAVLLISHDLRLVANHSDRVAVLYAGRVAETGPTAEVIRDPRHPYTRALLAASPLPGGGHAHALLGAPPSPGEIRPGCAFAPRCPSAQPICHEQQPRLVDGVACWAVNP